jgi:hypothetical protein
MRLGIWRLFLIKGIPQNVAAPAILDYQGSRCQE